MIKPQTVRPKHIIIPSRSHNIKSGVIQVTHRPITQVQAISLRPQVIKPPLILSPVAVKMPSTKHLAVSKRKEFIKRVVSNAKVKYITNPASPESLPKIIKLRNSGVGKILIIIGNGPSILEIPLEQIKNHPKIHTLSINRPDNRIWPSEHWTFFDLSQYRRNQELWNNYEGNIFNSTSIKQQKNASIQFTSHHGKGFSLDLTKGLYIGRSSLFASMQIGLWMNYDKIYIFGCDMCKVNDKLHFYGVNQDVAANVRISRFKNEAEHYDNAASILDDQTRQRFIFCSNYNTWGFINKFGRLDHTIAIKTILESL